MRIALIGYGKMGKLIDEIAQSAGHQVVARIGSQNSGEIDHLREVDVAIEFSRPEAALSNFEKLIKQGIPTVTGTTGWRDEMSTVEQWVEEYQTPFFHASNFSIGVFLTRAATRYIAGLVQNFSEYEAKVSEWHHTAKLDAPSGTALSLADDVIGSHGRYSKSSLQPGVGHSEELPIFAFREDEIPGTHVVEFSSPIDSISLKHEAFNRQGFARGAISAAEFILDKPVGVYTMHHLINLPE